MTSSYILLTYNNESTIAEALQSALRQLGDPLDILVSDDCSADRTFEIIKAIAVAYVGPHNLRCYRQPQNLGLFPNLDFAAAHCGGDLIILAAGDDRSRSDRAQLLRDAWIAAGHPSSAVVYSDVQPIDAFGEKISDWRERIARPPWSLERLAEGRGGPLGAACAITPRLFSEPSPIIELIRHEDRVFPFRALLLGGQILFVDQQLVDYRVEGGFSRLNPGTRYEELTVNLERRLTHMLPDARQRLADAIAVNVSPRLVRRCRQVIAEQIGMVAMTDGRQLLKKAAIAVGCGARLSVMLKQLARFAAARAEAITGKLS